MGDSKTFTTERLVESRGCPELIVKERTNMNVSFYRVVDVGRKMGEREVLEAGRACGVLWLTVFPLSLAVGP